MLYYYIYIFLVLNAFAVELSDRQQLQNNNIPSF